MKSTILAAVIALRLLAPSSTEASIFDRVSFAIASQDVGELSPNDCSRGIDEANQEACSQE